MLFVFHICFRYSVLISCAGIGLATSFTCVLGDLFEISHMVYWVMCGTYLYPFLISITYFFKEMTKVKIK